MFDDEESGAVGLSGARGPEVPSDAWNNQTRSDLVMELVDLREYLIERKGVNPSTVEKYVINARAFLRETASIVDPDEYNKFLVNHVVKKRNVHCLPSLKHYVEWKFSDKKKRDLREDIIDAMKMVRAGNTNIKKTIKVLDVDTVEGVIANINHDAFRVVAMLQYCLGVRANDVLKVRRDDVAWEPYKERSVMVITFTGKGNKRYRMSVFDESIAGEVAKCVVSVKGKHADYVFLDEYRSRAGEVPLFRVVWRNYSRYLYHLKHACFVVGVGPKDWSSHDFRRMMARKLWVRWHDIMMIKEFLHHERFDTTVRYLVGMGLSVRDVQSALYDAETILQTGGGVVIGG